MAKKDGKKALGRGLDAIFSDVEEGFAKEYQNGNHEAVLEIEIEKISPNIFQPRKNFDEEALKELSESIQRHGLIQPIIVIEKNGAYMLIAGERRLRASKLAGNTTIRAIVADLKDKNLRELALIENIQRENLNPIELANTYKELIDEYKITQDELGKIIKKSRPVIANTLRLLKLSDFTQSALIEGKITAGHAKVLVGFDQKQEKEILNSILGQKLTAAQTEKLVQRLKNDEISSPKVAGKIDKNFESEILKLKKILENYGKISVKNKKITINFEKISKIQALIDKVL